MKHVWATLVFALIAAAIVGGVVLLNTLLGRTGYPLLAWVHKHWLVSGLVVVFISLIAYAIRTRDRKHHGGDGDG